ncbi:MAG: dihydroorotate dehydrogenase, partial [Candidatus Marinimicrobia bacterium]|nr:dihydroorotate dehydrogenase [Candidatus Neomarinimicrobiota bacterium]
EDIIEFILAGADLVQIGTLNYREPGISIRLAEELDLYCRDNNLTSISDLKGLAEYR